MFFGNFISRKTELFNQLNPERIYIENIRSFFNISFRFAKLLCELAVRKNYFIKHTSITCPNCSRIIVTDPPKSQTIFHCDICELNEEDKFEFDLSEVKRGVYYQLNKEVEIHG